MNTNRNTKTEVTLSSPFDEVNEFVDFFRPQNVYELKGEPGSGKSVFIKNLLKSNKEHKILLIDPLNSYVIGQKNVIHRTDIFYTNELKNELNKYVSLYVDIFSKIPKCLIM
jgi:hypothetical protein